MTAGASAILMVTGGGTLTVAAFIDRDPAVVVTDAGQVTPSAGTAGSELPSAASGLGRQKPKNGADRRPEPRPTATSGAAVRPAAEDDRVVTTRTVSETRVIPYQTRRVPDQELASGDQRIDDPGNEGEETRRYRVTYVNGRLTDRRLLNSEVTREPTSRVVAFGTRPDPEPVTDPTIDPTTDPTDDADCPAGAGECPPARRTESCPAEAAAPGTEGEEVTPAG
jgi:arylsulfatase A-like enzyme